MRVLIIGYTHSKYDKRVFRTVKALSKYCDVIYQYMTFDNGEKIYTEGNINYIPIYVHKNSFTSHPYLKLVYRLPFDRRIINLIIYENYDILYMHHFVISKPVLSFRIAKNKNKRVIYDIHEYHPQNFLAHLKGLKRILKEKIMFHIFRKQISLSDKLIFVSQDTAEDIMRILKIKREYLIVPNYASKAVTADEKRKEIVLVGKMERSLYEEKEILKILSKHGFKFKIIGSILKTSESEDIEYKYTGFLPYEEMMVEISKASFSLISYKTTDDPNYKNDIFALPNKYYDSLAAETPVIVNKRFVTMAREVEKLGIGVVIDTTKPKEAVRKILDAYENYDELIANIRKHKEKFIWTEDKEKEFIDFVCK